MTNLERLLQTSESDGGQNQSEELTQEADQRIEFDRKGSGVQI